MLVEYVNKKINEQCSRWLFKSYSIVLKLCLVAVQDILPAGEQGLPFLCPPVPALAEIPGRSDMRWDSQRCQEINNLYKQLLRAHSQDRVGVKEALLILHEEAHLADSLLDLRQITMCTNTQVTWPQAIQHISEYTLSSGFLE